MDQIWQKNNTWMWYIVDNPDHSLQKQDNSKRRAKEYQEKTKRKPRGNTRNVLSLSTD